MAKPTINLITAPDKLHTTELSFLLLNPSNSIKEQFNDVIKSVDRTVNLYLYEEYPETGYADRDVEWLLDVIQLVDYIILDIDMIKDLEWLVGHILSFDKTIFCSSSNFIFSLFLANRTLMSPEILFLSKACIG